MHDKKQTNKAKMTCSHHLEPKCSSQSTFSACNANIPWFHTLLQESKPLIQHSPFQISAEGVSVQVLRPTHVFKL